MLPADNTEADSAPGCAPAFGGLAVALCRERLAGSTAAAAGGRRGGAALDTDRAVGETPLCLDTGAMGPAARDKAGLAAGLAGERPALSTALA